MTIIESEQSKDIKLTEIIRGPFTFRFLSNRKREDAKLNLRSEDYIVSQLNSDKAIFALCDGVGSSFYGNIGSQIIGEILLNWMGKVSLPNNLTLEKAQDVNSFQNKLTKELTSELNSKVAFATSIIQKKEIISTDKLVQLAEITQRDDFGTQSNFASGILWPRSSSLPNGLILLFWLGNARIRIFNQNKDLTRQLGWGNNPDQLTEVWSSKDGVIGKIYSYTTDFSKITSLIAYSDGLENVEEQIQPNLNGIQLEKIVNQSQSVKDDDVTYLEISTIPGEVAGIKDDIVGTLRRSTAVPSSQPSPESNELKQDFASLQKKYNAQSLKIKTARTTLIVISITLSVLCLSAGLLLGYVFSGPKPPPPTISPSVTLTPSQIPTFSETPTFTQIPTDTLTQTETITPTHTIIANTETITPTFTNTPSTPIP